jgi:hypothetical protein
LQARKKQFLISRFGPRSEEKRKTQTFVWLDKGGQFDTIQATKTKSD